MLPAFESLLSFGCVTHLYSINSIRQRKKEIEY